MKKWIITGIAAVVVVLAGTLYFFSTKKVPEFKGSYEGSSTLTVRLNDGSFFDVAIDAKAGNLLYTDGFSLWEYEKCKVNVLSTYDVIDPEVDGLISWDTRVGTVTLHRGNTWIQVASEKDKLLTAPMESFYDREPYIRKGSIPKKMKPSATPEFNDVTDYKFFNSYCVSNERPNVIFSNDDTIAYGVGTDYQQIFTRYVPFSDAKEQLLDTMATLHGEITAYGADKNIFWVEANGYYGLLRQENLNTVTFFYSSPKFYKYSFASCYGLKEGE